MTPLKIRGLSIRSVLYYSLVLLGIALFVGYVMFQARFLIVGPHLTFLQLPAAVQTSRVITLQGIAYNIEQLTLDGRQIYTDKNGYFKEALVLENGYTIATLQARDRYGHIRTYTEHFVYTPAATTTQQ